MKSNAQLELNAIRGVLQFDRRALEELLLLRFDWLLTIATQSIPPTMRNAVVPEDILQVSFVRILRDFEESTVGGGQSELFQWLKSVVENTSTEAIRRKFRKNQNPVSDRPQKQLHDSVSALLESLAIVQNTETARTDWKRELSQTFQLAMACLKPKYRSVIQGLYFDNLSLEEVASQLNISPASVRGIRQRAREKIRDEVVRLSQCI